MGTFFWQLLSPQPPLTEALPGLCDLAGSLVTSSWVYYITLSPLHAVESQPNLALNLDSSTPTLEGMTWRNHDS